jgi:hypothetical protein
LTGGSGSTLSTPAAPSGLTVTANADGSRSLAWTAPTGTPAADFYRVYRDGATGCSTPANYTCRVDTADAAASTLSTATTSGALSVQVADLTGFNVGDSITIDSGASQETKTILSINTSLRLLSLNGSLSFAHAQGVPIVNRTVRWDDTNTGGSSHTYRVTAVSSALAESDFATPGAVTG